LIFLGDSVGFVRSNESQQHGFVSNLLAGSREDTALGARDPTLEIREFAFYLKLTSIRLKTAFVLSAQFLRQ
jgi:hypothetical protein